MVVSRTEQESRDFDWFGVDNEGFVGHFATSGFKYLPVSVSASAEDLARVTIFFEDEAPEWCGHRVNDDLASLVDRPCEGDEGESRYLRSFVKMANRGLYSYDIDSYVAAGLSYFQVANPLRPRALDHLREDIRKIVARTQLGLTLRESPRILYEATLSI